jgi:hypothetical protein
VRLTTSLLSWDKVIWLCCAGSTLAPESLVLRRTTLLHQHLRSKPRFPTGSIKPWFHTEGKLAAALIIPSSWGSQLTCDVQALFLALLPGRYSLVNLELATRFLAPLPGKTELLLQGESLTPNLFTLLFVLLSLFLFSLVCSLYQKHKKISYLFNSV